MASTLLPCVWSYIKVTSFIFLKQVVQLVMSTLHCVQLILMMILYRRMVVAMCWMMHHYIILVSYIWWTLLVALVIAEGHRHLVHV